MVKKQQALASTVVHIVLLYLDMNRLIWWQCYRRGWMTWIESIIVNFVMLLLREVWRRWTWDNHLGNSGLGVFPNEHQTSRHSSNTTSHTSRQLPSYHEAIKRKSQNSYNSSTLPQQQKKIVVSSPSPSNFSQQQHYKVNNNTLNSRHPATSITLSPDQPIHVQIEKDNMDYCWS
jgi:hypothetical protein